MFGKDVERGAGRLAYLFILVLKGSCEEWDDALVAQAPQLPGCFGTHRRVVVGQSVPQLRNGITTNQRREGKDRTRRSQSGLLNHSTMSPAVMVSERARTARTRRSQSGRAQRSSEPCRR